MDYEEDEFLQLSGLQHYAYCPRQWALIALEDQWAENVRTVEGNQLHERAHDADLRGRRGDLLTVRGLSIRSRTLGVSGQCDVVEFRRDPNGVPLHGEEGLWLPAPVEYKRGRPKPHDADRLQLCCQALCLEEMLLCPRIEVGYLYYGETARRESVELTSDPAGYRDAMPDGDACHDEAGAYAKGKAAQGMQRMLAQGAMPAPPCRQAVRERLYRPALEGG